MQRRRKQEDKDPANIPGLWAWNIRQLLRQGLPEERIAERLRAVRVEPVLTAHPTEAKRTTVLEHHRELYLLLLELENDMFSKWERDNIRNNIKLGLTYKSRQPSIRTPPL